MDANEVLDRLHRTHAAVGLGRLSGPGCQIEPVLQEIAAAVAPWRLPADLLTFWRSVDPDTLAVAPCPRPADPLLSLRLWQEHVFGDPVLGALGAYFPWGYESHDFMLVELDPADAASGGACFSWAGAGSPVVRRFPSVAAYVDLLATMIELQEFVDHPQHGVIEFDPGRRWTDAQVVRLAGCQGPFADRAAMAWTDSPVTSVRALLDRAASGESPTGLIRARVVSLSGCAAGTRIEVDDGTGRLDLWCPAALAGGPILDRLFDFDVSLQPGVERMFDLADVSDGLRGIELATRKGDLRTAVGLATPLYDRLFGTPAPAQARAIRPAG
jgi:hypothetical protein